MELPTIESSDGFQILLSDCYFGMLDNICNIVRRRLVYRMECAKGSWGCY